MWVHNIRQDSHDTVRISIGKMYTCVHTHALHNNIFFQWTTHTYRQKEWKINVKPLMVSTCLGSDSVASCWLFCVLSTMRLLLLCSWLRLSPLHPAGVSFPPFFLLTCSSLCVNYSAYVYPGLSVPSCQIDLTFGLGLPSQFQRPCSLPAWLLPAWFQPAWFLPVWFLPVFGLCLRFCPLPAPWLLFRRWPVFSSFVWIVSLSQSTASLCPFCVFAIFLWDQTLLGGVFRSLVTNRPQTKTQCSTLY